mgnify:CR=1 FL=1
MSTVKILGTSLVKPCDDFMALVAGKADAQKLFFGGKLKLSGNIMLSQKLEGVLKGIDREMVIESIALHEKTGGQRGHYVRG